MELIFREFPGAQSLSFDDFTHYNRVFSSETFFSLMALLHERLPCAPNIFRMKRVFRKQNALGETISVSCKSQSPVREIASPRMMKGISLFKCGNPDTQTPIVTKHVSSSTNDEEEEEQQIESFQPLSALQMTMQGPIRPQHSRKNSNTLPNATPTSSSVRG